MKNIFPRNFKESNEHFPWKELFITYFFAQLFSVMAKLTNIINWSWWVVFLPVLFLIFVFLLVLVITIIIAFFVQK